MDDFFNNRARAAAAAAASSAKGTSTKVEKSGQQPWVEK
jgi:hypothetical protein